MIYAYLQGGRDTEAKNALKAALHGRPDDPQYMNWLYATGTSGARYAVERHQLAGGSGAVGAAEHVPP